MSWISPHTFKTVDGVEVVFEDLFVLKTYSGLMLGLPSEYFNTTLQSELRKRTSIISDCNELVIFSPQVTERFDRNGNSIPCLPAYCCTAVFMSYSPVEEGNAASTAALHWYQDTYDVPNNELAFRIETLDWKANAFGFNP